MSAGSFEKSSIQWQFQQFGRRVQEWFELQLFNAPELPEGSPSPDWLIETIFWIVATAIAAWLLWYLYLFIRALLQNLPDSPSWLEQRAPAKETVPVSGWLRQAQAFQRQGNYAQACRALYMAMLQRLDDTKQLPQQASRTDGEYLNVVQTFAKPQPYQVLIRTHEQVCFDNTAVSQDTFEHCQRAYQEIEAQ